MIPFKTHVAIIELRNTGKTIAHIASELHISTRTVQKYLKRPPNIDKTTASRASRLDEYKERITQLLNIRTYGEKQRYTIKRAFEQITSENPLLNISYRAFCEYVHNHCERNTEPKLARIPLNHEPGEAPIDFCQVIYYKGTRKTTGHQFTIYFPFSGVALALLYPSENRPCLLDALLSCFQYIGFVPRSVLFDNACTAVDKVTKDQRKINETYEAFANWYGFQCVFL